ncbi:MAG: FtsQ-type POTRA domain-containing protein [Oscillospiraceae bacterium]|jgi:hypothetical protein|nr:FtsQ-type POTRA domain-containing protein [Oscillospiraceae bacterium]
MNKKQPPQRTGSHKEVHAYGSTKSRGQAKRSVGNPILYVVMTVIIALIVFAVLSFTVLFNVKTIVVVGGSYYSDEQIVSAGGIKTGQSLLKSNLDKAAKNISAELPYVKSVTATPDFFSGKVTYTVTDDTVFYSLKDGKEWLLLSNELRCLERAAKAANGSVKLTGIKPNSDATGTSFTTDTPEKEQLAVKIAAQFKEMSLSSVTSLDITDYVSVKFSYNDSVEVWLGDPTELSAKLGAAKKILTSELVGKKGVLRVTNPKKIVFAEEASVTP